MGLPSSSWTRRVQQRWKGKERAVDDAANGVVVSLELVGNGVNDA